LRRVVSRCGQTLRSFAGPERGRVTRAAESRPGREKRESGAERLPDRARPTRMKVLLGIAFWTPFRKRTAA
jgi:hypothetical protein